MTGDKRQKSADLLQYAPVVEELRTMRETLRGYIIEACGCAHEQRLAHKFGSFEAYLAATRRGVDEVDDDAVEAKRHENLRDIAEATLCKDRRKKPHCAHRIWVDETKRTGYVADPLGDEIRRLEELGIIDGEWHQWSQREADQIMRIDDKAGDERFTTLSLPVVRAKQAPIIETLRAARGRLVSILDQIIDATDEHTVRNA